LGLIFIWVALSIAIATVVGGYHYAADVLLALLVAVLAFVGTFWFW
jgi:membrane-associated phospholipid phosphatase